jgi:DNA helicase-2/ATP-dependent DNA helicase PcrA
VSVPDDPIRSQLNEQQYEAVTHGEGPQLVIAGAGSGKTRVITYRVAWLIHELGIDPRSVVAVTFTNKAAGEMRDRIEGLVGIYPLPSFVGTFHRLSLDLLRRYGQRVGVRSGFAIFDREDQIALVKKALEAEQLSDASFPPRPILSAISGAKNKLLDPGEFEATASGFFQERVARVYRRYQTLLVQANGVDFDDMLVYAVRLLADNADIRERIRDRIDYLLVDEFQDTNHVQLRLVLELAGPDGNVTAVGDEDQGIYRWRGAELDNILDFEGSFPGATIRKLERNYRSTQNILSAAGAVVENNQGRRGKTLWTDAGDGDLLELYKARDEKDEARWVVNTIQSLRGGQLLSEMAVLVRTNAQTRVLEEELLRQQLPYVLVAGVRFYERAEIKDLVAYLRVLRNPRDNFSLLRILNRPPRGIGKATQKMLEDQASSAGVPLWEVLHQDQLGGFSTRAAKALRAFHQLIESLRHASEALTLPELLEQMMEETGYPDLFRKEDPDSQAKLENLREFVSAVQEFTEERESEGEEDLLTAFLDHASLVSDIDDWHPERGVSLMTLHSAKGLEFPVVFLPGLEHGLLPHFNAGGSLEDIEEERRLLYVGMTRAEKRLFLATCRRRRVAGRYQDQIQSQFIEEIPTELVEVTESPELFRTPRTRGVYSFFGRQDDDGLDEIHGQGEFGELTVKRGARVRHPSLGEGVVLGLDGEGDDAKLTVYFDHAGKRKLIARYANLELV